MNVVILSNPISGSGRATVAADDLADVLRQNRHHVTPAHTRKEPTDLWLDPLLTNADLLVVVGGDGAVRMASEAAIRRGTPIYHIPMGTENLFAYEFGMDRDPKTLLLAMEHQSIRTVDVGTVLAPDPTIFTLMLSVGFDAEVVHELARRRGASISHLSYAVPILGQLLRWRPTNMEITVDGEQVHPANPSEARPASAGCDDSRGNRRGEPAFVVIANCRQYGWRMNPADRAAMDDGLLDVVCFPARSALDVIRWTIKCIRRRQFDDPRLIYRRGRRITIRCGDSCHYQMDGDPGSVAGRAGAAGTGGPGAGAPMPNGPLHLEIEVRPSALRVLVPVA